MNQDEALLLVREQDMKLRLSGGQAFIEFLASPNGDLSQWSNIDKIIDSLAMYWVSTSNHKVELLGLDILSLLVERLQGDFHIYYNLIHSTLVDRLGDQKDQVRDASITLLTNIMDVAASPQILFEKLASGFGHKSWRVREGLCRLLVATINRFGSKSLHLSRMIPHLCKLLSDQHAQVRDVAVSTIVEIYRHVGDKVRQDLAKKGLPPAKLHVLYEKFDVMLQSGDMVMRSETGSIASSSGSFESLDSGSSLGFGRPSASGPTHSAAARSAPAMDTVDSGSSRSAAQAKKSAFKPSLSRSKAGAVDEESFIRDFELNLPQVRIYSPRDVEEQMNQIAAVLGNEARDWEERIKALRSLRAVAISGGTEFDSFHQHLRVMEPALQGNAKDLRSQVVRETCVTIGFLSSSLKHRFEHSACVLLPTLFGLVPNAAKVVSTSVVLAIRTTLKHTHGQRMVPIVAGYASSRTTSIRRHTFICITLMFEHWPTNIFDKHSQQLKEVVQKGIADADAEAREEARRAWHGLHQHFPSEADEVFHSLNLNQQRLIKGPASASSLDNLSNTSSRKTRTSVATTGTGPRRVVSRAPPSAGLRAPGVIGGNKFLRSRSDIDPISAKRSQMKALSSGYGTVGRNKRLNTHHLSVTKAFPSEENRGRKSSRPAASQPGSRSGSPPYHGGKVSALPGRKIPQFNETDGVSTRTPPSSPTPTRRSRIPVSNSRTGSRAGSRLGSRATSPTGSRSGSPPRYKAGRSTSSTSHPPPMRVLPKGKEGEQAIHDALSRKLFRKSEYDSDEDDMSDTSSVCSERSYTNRNGMKRQQAAVEDVAEILQMCQSTQWTERKEGLTCLHTLIYRKKVFSRIQMKRVLEIFNRMFADPHGKVFSMFLEMLPDFITNYSEELHDWVYILLTQLLKKLGTDLLGSVQAKVLKTLQIVRESFPTQLQFNILSRYIIDQTQRPNLKVKIGLLHFLIELTSMMPPSEIANTSDTRLALSRIITWTTEPKSPDVRKAAEVLVVTLFELNAPAFTNMIRVLPKTFQDGAMKVLQSGKPISESTMAPDMKPGGQVVSMVGISPKESFVDPGGDTGSVGLRSPRGSTDEMDGNEIAENFRDIAAGIQKLRMDSNADEFVRLRENLSSPSKHDFHKPSYHRMPPGKENKYNPDSYSSPPKFDDDDAFGEELPDLMDNNIADVALAFSSGKDKRRTLDNLCAVLRGSESLGGLAASQQLIQWDQHFKTILSGVLEVVRTGTGDSRVTALHTLKEMLRKLSNRFTSYAETTVVHVLEAHTHASKEVSRSADDCGASLSSLLPPTLCVKVLSPLTKSASLEAVPACLKMLTNAINRSSPEEMTNQIVAGLVPGLLQCYDNPESGIRKAAVFCLVALHRVIGDANLCRHLGSLSGGKMKLLQLYIKRSQQTIDGSAHDL